MVRSKGYNRVCLTYIYMFLFHFLQISPFEFFIMSSSSHSSKESDVWTVLFPSKKIRVDSSDSETFSDKHISSSDENPSFSQVEKLSLTMNLVLEQVRALKNELEVSSKKLDEKMERIESRIDLIESDLEIYKEYEEKIQGE
jgi:cyclopropane fatty-acyl-phospholipid synthase-like methyltransferase